MFIKENRISMLFYLLKRKSMKITNRHRHITKSEYQPGIAMQAHDTTLLTLEDTTGNTDFLLFLKIILQRAIHQFDVIGHGFVQIDEFLHLALRDDCRTVRIIVRHQILTRKHGGQNEFQLLQGSADKQPAVAHDFLLVRQGIQLLGGTGGKGLFHHPDGITTGDIFFFSIAALLETFFMVGRSLRKHFKTKIFLLYDT